MPIGTRLPGGANASGASSPARTIRVSTRPGQMQLTRIPDETSSSAATFVRPRIANLDDTQPLDATIAACPRIDEIATIEPPPAAG
jgi:hypothetical protein